MAEEARAQEDNVDPDLHALDVEWETYLREKERLVAMAEGKYVLIKGNDVIGIYDSEDDAFDKGYDLFGNVPFLMHMIEKEETPLFIFSAPMAF